MINAIPYFAHILTVPRFPLRKRRTRFIRATGSYDRKSVIASSAVYSASPNLTKRARFFEISEKIWEIALAINTTPRFAHTSTVLLRERRTRRQRTVSFVARRESYGFPSPSAFSKLEERENRDDRYVGETIEQ